MKPDRSSESRTKLRRRDYICVIDTQDEFEGLIGIVDEFLLPDGRCTPLNEEGSKVIVFFPYTRDEIRSAKLTGVNILTSWVRLQLSQNEGKIILEHSKLEWFNKEEL